MTLVDTRTVVSFAVIKRLYSVRPGTGAHDGMCY
nr:MAG TPA_asm: hypothetical protein [Caudoviricetes sp.]